LQKNGVFKNICDFLRIYIFRVVSREGREGGEGGKGWEKREPRNTPTTRTRISAGTIQFNRRWTRMNADGKGQRQRMAGADSITKWRGEAGSDATLLNVCLSALFNIQAAISLIAFSRPSGTWPVIPALPRLKPWAIIAQSLRDDRI